MCYEKIIYLTFLIIATALVGCKNDDKWDSPYPATFYILAENSEGADLLDSDVEGNILGEKTQYLLDGDTLGIAWQHPYHIYDYKGFAYIKNEMIEIDDKYISLNVIATDFRWAHTLAAPVDFKLTIGENELPFTLYTEGSTNILILPDGKLQKVFHTGFIIKLLYSEDGSITASVLHGIDMK